MISEVWLDVKRAILVVIHFILGCEKFFRISAFKMTDKCTVYSAFLQLGHLHKLKLRAAFSWVPWCVWKTSPLTGSSFYAADQDTGLDYCHPPLEVKTGRNNNVQDWRSQSFCHLAVSNDTVLPVYSAVDFFEIYPDLDSVTIPFPFTL